MVPRTRTSTGSVAARQGMSGRLTILDLTPPSSSPAGHRGERRVERRMPEQVTVPFQHVRYGALAGQGGLLGEFAEREAQREGGHRPRRRPAERMPQGAGE